MNSEDISDDLAPPELRFRYSDFVLIGTGGMGRVIGARDSHLSRRVAIKLLPRNSENALAVMRFQQEAKAVSKLNNPHVVQVLDFGYTEAGEPYLVMEHVQGSSLQSCLETRGALPISEAIDIAVQLCDALEHAHANEVIHRDLKPGNIMVETGNVVKVLDFGLARIASADEADWRLTRPGQPIGSILYMSPEQVRGEDSGECSDVYSLGLVILKMIAGKLPFEGMSSLEIIKIRLEEEPPAIPEFTGSETRSDQALRGELNQVLRKALAFQVEDRYPNMTEFRKALLNVIERANQIVSAENKTGAEFTPERSNRNTIRLAFVLTALALCTVAYYFVDRKRTEDEKRLSTKHPVIVSDSDAEIRRKILSKQEALIANKFMVIGDRAHGKWKASDTVTDKDISQLVGIPISEISFEGNHLITHKGIETLSKFFPIRHITLRETNIDDRSMPFIGNMKKLYYVDFQNSLVTDDGITKLPNDLNLQYFDVKKLRGVTDRGLLHIIDSYPNIRLLSISGTCIGKTSFRQIPKLQHLQILRAAGLGLSDEDISCLADMQYLSSLDIQSNPITDKSIPTFKKMKLTSLLLEMCTLITHDGMVKLHSDLKGRTNITPKPIENVSLDNGMLELINDPNDPALAP